jgi:uncharacterized protein YndB with AHSA1/START domain
VNNRPVHPDLYPLSIGRLIRAPIETVYDAWLDEQLLKQWMTPRTDIVRHDCLTDRPQRLRFAWVSTADESETIVDLSFLATEAGQTMLLLKHAGLRSRRALEDQREHWRRLLDKLSELLERAR